MRVPAFLKEPIKTFRTDPFGLFMVGAGVLVTPIGVEMISHDQPIGAIGIGCAAIGALSTLLGATHIPMQFGIRSKFENDLQEVGTIDIERAKRNTDFWCSRQAVHVAIQNNPDARAAFSALVLEDSSRMFKRVPNF